MLMVTDLLADCLRNAGALEISALPACADASELPAARTAFLAAGLAAVRQRTAGTSWVQFNLAPAPDGHLRAYDWLGTVARELLDTGRARNFFFMHKEPGLRVRFEAPDGEREPLRAELAQHFVERGGWRQPPSGVVYEPEQYLFGGRASMPYVHRLFTHDSLAWLDHHARHPCPEGEATAWRRSLFMLREVFAGLGVVGWEHRGVWDVVREDTGRRLTTAARDGHGPGGGAAWRRAAEASGNSGHGPASGCSLRSPRNSGRPRRACRGPGRGGPTVAHRLLRVGRRHHRPAALAAYAVVFHWNRARMSFARQCLLAEALADDGRPDDAPRAGRGRRPPTGRGGPPARHRRADRTGPHRRTAGHALGVRRQRTALHLGRRPGGRDARHRPGQGTGDRLGIDVVPHPCLADAARGAVLALRRRLHAGTAPDPRTSPSWRRWPASTRCWPTPSRSWPTGPWT
ncbi:hypothetical protein O1L55_10390 [Streptomyces albulus]|nr:hypothetical protein [Streptomyces noursei]